MSPRDPPLRDLVWLSQLPVIAYAVGVFALSVWVLTFMQGRAELLAAPLPDAEAAGVLELADLVHRVWLACLAGLLFAAAAAAILAGRAYQRLATRMLRLSETVEQVARGEAVTLSPPRTLDPVGRLERALGRLAAASARREHQLEADAARELFQSQVARALELAGDEASTWAVARRVLEEPPLPGGIEVLVADPSHSQLRRVVGTVLERGPSTCQVSCPSDCPAARFGQTQVFPSARAIDACPALVARRDHERGAACIPMSVGGRTTGVVHAPQLEDRPLSPEVVRRLETFAKLLGARIGMLRTLAAVQVAAATDPLTGLANRRSLEEGVAGLLRSRVPFVLVVADLDHFKLLNDTYGHEAGDRALRAFAQTLQAATRATDVVARVGGEEFVLALPHCRAHDALAILEAVRRALKRTVDSGGVPSFTASFGVVESDDSGLDALLQRADQRLYRAKQEGRDRAVAADREVVGLHPVAGSRNPELRVRGEPAA